MESDRKTKILSHIIVYVDKNLPRDPFLSFCTNALSDEDKIRFTYLCYDNLIPCDACAVEKALEEAITDDPEQVFVISDSAEVLSYTAKRGIAAAALRTAKNRNSDLSSVLYCIEDMEYMPLEKIRRMWERFHGIPWTIAETGRLIIREQRMEDLDDLYKVYDDKEASRYMEDLYEDREKEAEYLRQYINSQYRFFEYGIWALVKKDDGTLIGRAGFSMREGYDDPEIGFIIGSGYRRQGYAKEALEAIMKYGQDEFGFGKYIAFTKEENAQAIGLLESLGFSYSLRADIRGGEHAMYSLTKQQ